jgi:hypothetical protein
MRSKKDETDPICLHCIEETGLITSFYDVCQDIKDQCPCIECIVGIMCSASCDALNKFDLEVERIRLERKHEKIRSKRRKI